MFSYDCNRTSCRPIQSVIRVVIYKLLITRMITHCIGLHSVLLPLFIILQEDTSRDIDWLQHVKTSHGSVAMSSLMEAKTINEQGFYSVGCHNEDESSLVPEQLTLPNVIKLRVPSGATGNSREYTLDDLKDLQSKLMLIAAKASHGKQDVDQFVDVS